MNSAMMNDTVVDQVLFPPTDTVADQVLMPPTTARGEISLEDLLWPENPAEGLLDAEDWVRLGRQLQLSDRECSVARLIFEGYTRFQIVRKLRCATGTVRVYIDRVFAKLKVVDRLGMALRSVARPHGTCRARRHGAQECDLRG